MSDKNTTAESTAESIAETKLHTMPAEVVEPTAIVVAEKADDGSHFPNQSEGELLTNIDKAQEVASLVTVESKFVPQQTVPASMAALYEKRHKIRFGPDNVWMGKDKTPEDRARAKAFVMWVKPSTDNDDDDIPFIPMMNQQAKPQEWLFDCSISDIRVVRIKDPGGSFDYHKVEIDVDQEHQAYTLAASVSAQSALSMLPGLWGMAESDNPLGLKQLFHLKAAISKKTPAHVMSSQKGIPVYVAFQDPQRPVYRNDYDSYKASFFTHQDTQESLDSHRQAIKELIKADADRMEVDTERHMLTKFALQQFEMLSKQIREMPDIKVDRLPASQSIEVVA